MFLSPLRETKFKKTQSSYLRKTLNLKKIKLFLTKLTEKENFGRSEYTISRSVSSLFRRKETEQILRI